MPRTEYNFTTGPATLPDIGRLEYNGCVFSPLFETKVTGQMVNDNAKRTVKLIEYTITADGYVTLPTGAASIGPTMATLYRLLTAQGGSLTYSGRALDIIVNTRGGGVNIIHAQLGKALPPIINADVAWGPVPEVLEFQPLGGNRSAKISWKVTVRLPAPAVANIPGSIGVLQLNYDTTVDYGEDGYSTLSIKGTIEMPLTRPAQATRTVSNTVDTFRSLLEKRILAGIDLARFRLTKRTFNISRDKRTMEWDVAAAEKSYMDLPPDCTIARGTYSFRPSKSGPGLVAWLCTLRANYTVRADRPRRTAWLAFLALLRLRMEQAKRSPMPDIDIGADNRINPLDAVNPLGLFKINKQLKAQIKDLKQKGLEIKQRAWLVDFSGEEGLYLDSKTASFSATWRMTSLFSHILLASGMWKKLPDGGDAPDKNLWALSMADVMGSRSWLANQLDPSADIIVDFGSTDV